MITYLCTNFNVGLAKPPLNLGHRWVITSNCFLWVWPLIRGSVGFKAGLDNLLFAKETIVICYLTNYPKCPVQGVSYRYCQLRWRHNGRDSVSNHQPHDCLLNRLFRRRSKKTSKLRVTGLCERNSPVTGEFPAQRDSNAEIVSIWWRHHNQ